MTFHYLGDQGQAPSSPSSLSYSLLPQQPWPFCNSSKYPPYLRARAQLFFCLEHSVLTSWAATSFFLIQDSVSLFRHLFHTPGPFLQLSPLLTSVLHLCMVWLLLCRAPVSPEDGIFLEDEENTLLFRSITVQHNSYCISAPQRRVEWMNKSCNLRITEVGKISWVNLLIIY